jgi:hypothetical protein
VRKGRDGGMNPEVKRVLTRIVEELPAGFFWLDPQGPLRFRGLLLDYCRNGSRAEINILCAALDAQVPPQLVASRGRESFRAILGRLAGRLEEEHAVRFDAALWAVEAWAVALGVALEQECTAARREILAYRADATRPQADPTVTSRVTPPSARPTVPAHGQPTVTSTITNTTPGPVRGRGAGQPSPLQLLGAAGAALCTFVAVLPPYPPGPAVLGLIIGAGVFVSCRRLWLRVLTGLSTLAGLALTILAAVPENSGAQRVDQQADTAAVPMAVTVDSVVVSTSPTNQVDSSSPPSGDEPEPEPESAPEPVAPTPPPPDPGEAERALNSVTSTVSDHLAASLIAIDTRGADGYVAAADHLQQARRAVVEHRGVFGSSARLEGLSARIRQRAAEYAQQCVADAEAARISGDPVPRCP